MFNAVFIPGYGNSINGHGQAIMAQGIEKQLLG
jgi:hypothetical protein